MDIFKKSGYFQEKWILSRKVEIFKKSGDFRKNGEFEKMGNLKKMEISKDFYTRRGRPQVK